MKLAEALSIRKDLQTRIEQLKVRLNNNLKVQEGDEPVEDPESILKEMDKAFSQLQTLIYRINQTNLSVGADGKNLTQLIAERDVLSQRTKILREAFNAASSTSDRYSRTEIKTVATLDAKKLGKEADQLSEKLRKLDMQIQAINFSVDLKE